MPMKISNDTIENRTRDHPACSAVPQPNAQPRDPLNKYNIRSVFVRSSEYTDLWTKQFLQLALLKLVTFQTGELSEAFTKSLHFAFLKSKAREESDEEGVEKYTDVRL